MVDDDEGEEEPHPTTAANPIAIKTRDILLLGIIEPLRGKWKFRQIEIWTNLSNMASEVSRFAITMIDSKLGTPANMSKWKTNPVEMRILFWLAPNVLVFR